MASLSPPKWIAALRKHDQDDLIDRLRALADEWNDGDPVMRSCARGLLELLDEKEIDP